MRKIEADKHQINKYVISFLFFREINKNGRQMQTCIKKNSFRQWTKSKHFDRNEYFYFWAVRLRSKKKVTIIDNCLIIISIAFKRHAKTVINWIVCFKNTIIISFRSQLCARIHHFNFFKERDFFFKSTDFNFDLYAHVLKSEIKNILFRNDEKKTIRISRNFRLSRVIEINYLNVYQMIQNETLNLIVCQTKQYHQNVYFQKLLRVCLFKTVQKLNQKTKTKNEITIHNSNSIFIRRFIKLINDYFIIWTNQRFAILFESEWMKNFFKKNFSFDFIKSTVYFLRIQNRKLMNQTFDEFHRKNRLQWIIQNTL